jgi:hypothetical protein
VEQLFSNLAALKLTVNESTIDRLKQLAKPANVYWAERKRLEWN